MKNTGLFYFNRPMQIIRLLGNDLKKGFAIHIIAGLISISIVFCLKYLLKNWQADNITEKVYCFNLFLAKWEHIVEIGMTLFIFFHLELFIICWRLLKRGAVAYASGMFFYRHNATNKELEESNQFLNKVSTNCNSLYVLAFSGWKTFGEKNSPLHQALLKSQNVKIILSYPLCDEVKMRAKKIGISFDEYRKEICSSIELLNSLRAPQRRIQLKMYRSPPLWKYIVLDDYVWIQQYPSDAFVQHSPCYAFEKTSYSRDYKTIFDHIFTQFLVRWDSASLGTYDFEKNHIEFVNKNAEPDILPVC
jgi:hypothetical protein